MSDLNRAGRGFARELIAAGRVDKTTAWSFSSEDGNELLGSDGKDWSTYGKHHLGLDNGEPFDTKDHWKYPFAKASGDAEGGEAGEDESSESTIYRSALVAIRQRASSQRDKAIYDAAGQLLDEIDGDTDRAHQNSAEDGDPIIIAARPPRIEIAAPRGDICSAPPSADMLEKWRAGIKAAGDPGANVVEIFDIIGYDFWTGGGITADSISAQLKVIGPNPVDVHLNTPGGDMFEGIAIYELFRAHPAPVTMKIMGIAASAGSIIAMAGDKREISQAGFFMIHNCWVLAMGNRNDFRDVAAYLEPFDKALCDVYVSCTKQKPAAVATWMDDETYIGANDAIKLGFANSIIDRAAITEDQSVTDLAKKMNSVRKVESLLTKKGGMTRTAARALIQDLKSGKRDAAADRNTGMPGAADNATQDAGDMSWVQGARALTEFVKTI